MTNKPKRQRTIRVTGADRHQSPDNARKLGKALIALARAQLEADAQAEANEKHRSHVVPIDKRKPSEKAEPDRGDAA